MATTAERIRRTSPAPGYNLLRVGWFRAVYLSFFFPYIVQAAILGVFVSLAVIGWGLSAPEGVQSKDFAKASLVTLLIWGLWWPAMVWFAVLFGRIWCAVCPLELVANVTERLGRRLNVKQRTLRGWLRRGFLILASYALIQMLVTGIELHRVPAYTSIFLWGLLVLAAVVGLAYKDTAFCRGFCPVGLLLATYGRGSMLAVRSAGREPCDNCSGKECRKGANRRRWDARSCPSLLNPAKLNESSDCLICGQCVKACPPANMGLYLRRPFHPADRRELAATWAVTLFVMLVSGFVAYELFSEWKSAQAAFLWVPQTVARTTGLASFEGWIKGIWMLLVVPLGVWSVLGGLVLLFRGAGSLAEAWKRLALPLAVVIAAGQMAKGLAKFVSWGGYLPGALQDPRGTETALAISAGQIDKPASLLSLAVVSVVSLMLLAAMAWFGIRESRLADPRTHRSRVPSILLAAAASAYLIFGWGFLQ